MSFSFNFLQSNDGANSDSPNELNHSNKDHQMKPFAWLSDGHERFLNQCLANFPAHDLIALDEGDSSPSRQYLARISERSKSSAYMGTDLVPGEYEGGDVVWECSLDLCRYLHRNSVTFTGHVIELGCGHGLPGCWALSQARKNPDLPIAVCFTDYNEFVLDATIANVVLNIKCNDSKREEKDGCELAKWLITHTALGSGDWNDLSALLQTLLVESQDKSSTIPAAVPSDGLFDCILAAETTYSEDAAADTARFVTNHLKSDGVAYIATKRYYFGVGGGSDAFRNGIKSSSAGKGKYLIETVDVVDDGASNIREILRVRRQAAP